MAGQTPRFGLNFFDAETPGTLDDDAQKYTGEDRLSIDQILAGYETHTHHLGVATLTEPGDVADLSYTSTGGLLSGGLTYYYVISFLNVTGQETITGPEASIAMPDLLEAPDPPAAETSTGSGTLPAGGYYYALTGLRGGEESTLGTPVAVTLTDTDNTITFTLPALGDATSYQLWRQKDTDSGWTRVGVDTTTIIDDGSVPTAAYGDPANIPPLTNAGTSSYTVTITLTGDDLTAVATAASWRIYRSTISGTYGAQALVHDVIERVDETDPTSALLTTWVDSGDAPLTGSPKLITSQLQIPPYTFEAASGALPATTGYPANYPILDADGALYVNRAGTWTLVGGAGSGSRRGVAWFTGHGVPAPEPSQALGGDLYLDLDTADVYRLNGPTWVYAGDGLTFVYPGDLQLNPDLTQYSIASVSQIGDATVYLSDIVPGATVTITAVDDDSLVIVATVTGVTVFSDHLLVDVTHVSGTNTYASAQVLTVTIS